MDFSRTENHKHKSLPDGKDLVGEDLKNVFERYAYHAEKLASSGAPKVMKVSTKW